MFLNYTHCRYEKKKGLLNLLKPPQHHGIFKTSQQEKLMAIENG
jgi:hypothetical protein